MSSFCILFIINPLTALTVFQSHSENSLISKFFWRLPLASVFTKYLHALFFFLFNPKSCLFAVSLSNARNFSSVIKCALFYTNTIAGWIKLVSKPKSSLKVAGVLDLCTLLHILDATVSFLNNHRGNFKQLKTTTIQSETAF